MRGEASEPQVARPAVPARRLRRDIDWDQLGSTRITCKPSPHLHRLRSRERQLDGAGPLPRRDSPRPTRLAPSLVHSRPPSPDSDSHRPLVAMIALVGPYDPAPQPPTPSALAPPRRAAEPPPPPSRGFRGHPAELLPSTRAAGRPCAPAASRHAGRRGGSRIRCGGG